MSKVNLTPPSVINSQIIFEESIIKIRRDTLQLNPDKTYNYYTLITKPFSVIILATTKEGLYIFNEEYRHPTGKILLSCPGGYIDEGETPLEAAKRELLEETGFEAEDFELIGSAYPYAGISEQKTFYFRAQMAKRIAEPQLEISEYLQTVLKSKDDLQQVIDQGITLDGPLCTALFFDRFKIKKI